MVIEQKQIFPVCPNYHHHEANPQQNLDRRKLLRKARWKNQSTFMKPI
jgi:hypothetical protein